MAKGVEGNRGEGTVVLALKQTSMGSACGRGFRQRNPAIGSAYPRGLRQRNPAIGNDRRLRKDGETNERQWRCGDCLALETLPCAFPGVFNLTTLPLRAGRNAGVGEGQRARRRKRRRGRRMSWTYRSSHVSQRPLVRMRQGHSLRVHWITVAVRDILEAKIFHRVLRPAFI